MRSPFCILQSLPNLVSPPVNNFSNIHFHCPHCRVSLSVPMKLAGVTGPCPQCSAQITAPLTNLVNTPAAPAPTVARPAPEQTTQTPAPRIEPLRSEHRGIASRRPKQNSIYAHFLRVGIPLTILGLLMFGMSQVSNYLKRNSLTQPAKKETISSLKSPLDESIAKPKQNTIEKNTTTLPTVNPVATTISPPPTIENSPSNAIKVKPLTIQPKEIPDDEPLAGEVASRVLEQFLSANTFNERMMYIHSHRKPEELQQTILATKWPTAQFTPGTQIKNPDPSIRLTEFYYKVTFGENSYNFPTEATFLLHQRGDEEPKVVLEPLLDNIGGRLREFAKTPTVAPQDFYVIMDARVRCIDETIPESESKFSFYLRAHTSARGDIATAYAKNTSSVRAEFDNPVSGLKWRNPTPVVLTLQWNTKIADRPFLEVIEIKSKNWNP